MYTHTKSVGAQLHEFVICASSEVDNERRELMLKLVQFTGMPFPDLNPNSYTFDNLNYEIRFKYLQKLNQNFRKRAIATWVANSPTNTMTLPLPYIKILPNVRSTVNAKKQYKSVKALTGLQIPKIKCNCLNNASSFLDFLTSTILLPFLSVLQYLCNANLTVDVTKNFTPFVLIFQLGSRSFQYYLAVRKI